MLIDTAPAIIFIFKHAEIRSPIWLNHTEPTFLLVNSYHPHGFLYGGQVTNRRSSVVILPPQEETTACAAESILKKSASDRWWKIILKRLAKYVVDGFSYGLGLVTWDMVCRLPSGARLCRAAAFSGEVAATYRLTGAWDANETIWYCLKIGVPQIINGNRIFHYTPSIWW